MEGKMPNAGNKLVIKTAPWTNGDAIRSMTDVELAIWINHLQADAYGRGIMEMAIVNYPNTYSNWLDWMRKEAKE